MFRAWEDSGWWWFTDGSALTFRSLLASVRHGQLVSLRETGGEGPSHWENSTLENLGVLSSQV